MVCFISFSLQNANHSADDSVLLAQCMTKLVKPGLRIFVSMGRNRGGEEAFVKTMADQGYDYNKVWKLETLPNWLYSRTSIIQSQWILMSQYVS